jgi:CHAD domain-containing protein
VLGDSVQRGARRLGLDLLASVREERDRLDDLSDKEALHDFRVALRRLRSWLRAFRPALSDTLGPKAERRLKRIASATGDSRDLEVHVAWVVGARRSLSETARVGANVLLQRLRRDKRDADAEFRSVIDRKFDRAAEDAETALSKYEASVTDEGERFATVIAETIELQMMALSNAIGRVSGQGDRVEAHAARIAAKRLRYLLEGVEDASPNSAPLIEQLKDLQDTLGELHDAQLFGGELATMISELLAGQEGAPSTNGRREAHPRANPVTGLRVLSQRLRRAETTAFRAYNAAWSAGATATFAERVARVAAEIRAVAAATNARTSSPSRARAHAAR